MYESLKLLGRLKSSGDVFSRIIGKMPENYTHGIAVCFNSNGGYVGVRQRKNNGDFAYKKAHSASKTLPLPITMFSERIENTINRLGNTLESFSKNEELGDFAVFCKKIFDSWQENEKQIKTDTLEAYESLKQHEENIFIYASHDDNALTPLTENNKLKNHIKKSFVTEQYGKRSNTICQKEKGVCSVCGNEPVTVYGNFSMITCYTLDKESVIAGGFNIGQAVDNFPVCADCIIDISDGFRFAGNELTSNMAGFQYMALPKALTGDEELNRNVIDELFKKYKKRQKAGELRHIAGTEKELIQMLDDENIQDDVSLLLVFFAKSKAQWSILLEIEELLPSRVRDINSALNDTEDKVKRFFNIDKWHYTFRIFRSVFGQADAGKTHQKIVQYLDAIFSDHPLSESDVIAGGVSSILSVQRKALKGEQDFSYFAIRDAFATWLFFKYLQLFHDQKRRRKMEYLDQFSGPYVDVIHELSDFFDQPDKVAAFLIGCYVDSTAYAQSAKRGEGGKRGNEPFRKRVIGRKMNPEYLKRLYPEAMSKLRQYDAFGLVARDLDPLTAYCIAKAGNDWKSSDEALTLAFSIGMSINGKLIKPKKEDEENDAA